MKTFAQLYENKYKESKSKHPGVVILFKVGDFYELFYDDAETAAKILGLTITTRDKNSENPVPMAGFPYHAIDVHVGNLLRAGYRTAVIDLNPEILESQKPKTPAKRKKP